MNVQNDSVLVDISDCVLVDLNISTWTGRKLDKKVSEEIDSAKNTKTKAGNYHKHLLAGTQKLEQVQKLVGTIRTWHYEQTTVWSDGGSRLLPMANFFDYKRTLDAFQQQFDDAVEEFLVEYPQLVSAAAFQLGGLFDRTEYPEVETLRNKFKFRYALCPLPTASDFRIQAGEEVKQQLAAQYEEYFNNKLQDAMKDLWGRLHEVLTHMSAKLADAPVPRKAKEGGENYTQIFRDSLVTNAIDLCSLLTKLNITNDPQLEQARQKLERAIAGMDAEVIRESDSVRHDVKRKVDEILSAFNF
jgi:hypothetical protein